MRTSSVFSTSFCTLFSSTLSSAAVHSSLSISIQRDRYCQNWGALRCCHKKGSHKESLLWRLPLERSWHVKVLCSMQGAGRRTSSEVSRRCTLGMKLDNSTLGSKPPCLLCTTIHLCPIALLQRDKLPRYEVEAHGGNTGPLGCHFLPHYSG